jgi:hypothetical protein
LNLFAGWNEAAEGQNWEAVREFPLSFPSLQNGGDAVGT